jgi:hypothetical protein
MRKIALLALVLLSPSLRPASAQSVISARSGLVNFLEGVVFLDGQPLARKSGAFARMRDGSTLSTESGRAEVLLTPDTYLRIGENSGIRMISDNIADTQVELLAGSAILDSAKAPAGEFVRMVFRDTTIRILKPGHYRMDAEPPQLRVFAGEAEVARDGKTVKLDSSQLLPLDGSSVVKRFTEGSDGLLDLWSEERGELIASKMLSAGAISDPLLDSGPGVPADFGAYVGYMSPGYLPLASIAPAGTLPGWPLSSFGYGPGGYGVGGYGFGGYGFGAFYPAMGLSAYVPRPAASFLYSRYPARSYTPVQTGRPALSGSFVAPPRGIFVPRPVFTARPPARAGAPVIRPGRPAGRR